MRLSAGLLLHHGRPPAVEVLLAHMGGPFWARRDAGAWSVPKGEYEPGEDPLAAACREFAEELGSPPPPGEPVLLGVVRQPSGKRVTAFALEGDLDPATVASNEFTLEWPRGSGRLRSYPEVDRAEWFPLDVARTKLVPGQVPILDLLAGLLAGRDDAPT
jgi:predicted NUDIX family NTP pyrophosphohydrolase